LKIIRCIYRGRFLGLPGVPYHTLSPIHWGSPTYPILALHLEYTSVTKDTFFYVTPLGTLGYTLAIRYRVELGRVLQVALDTSPRGNREIYPPCLKILQYLWFLRGLSTKNLLLFSFFSKRPMILDEEKVLNFAAAIIRYKFINLYKIDDKATNKATKAESDIVKGYQETLPILQKILKSKDFLLAAQITKVLADARKIHKFINQTLIDESLKFIKDGGFNVQYDKNSDYHRDVEFEKSRKTIQTALIAEALMKIDSSDINFNDYIKKSLDSIYKDKNNFGNYGYAVGAYVMALNNDNAKAAELLNKVDISEINPVQIRKLPAYAEIFSYMIRTNILIGKTESEWHKTKDGLSLINNLMSKIRKSAEFYSPYDAVLALEALFEYTKFKDIRTNNLEIQVKGRTINLNHFESIEISNNDELKVLNDDLGYMSQIKEEKYDFKAQFFKVIKFKTNLDKNKLDIKIDFSLEKKSNEISNLIVLEADLPRGFKYVEHKETNAEIVVRLFRNY